MGAGREFVFRKSLYLLLFQSSQYAVHLCHDFQQIVPFEIPHEVQISYSKESTPCLYLRVDLFTSITSNVPDRWYDWCSIRLQELSVWFQIYEEHLNLVGSMQLNDIDGHTNLPGGGLYHSSCHLSPQSKKCGTREWGSFEMAGHDDNNLDCNHLLYLLLPLCCISHGREHCDRS